MKRWSVLVTIRDMRIKNVSIITSQCSGWPSLKSLQMLERMWRKGNPPTLLMGKEISTTMMGNSVEIPKKPKNRVTIRSNNLTPGHRSKENSNSKAGTHPYVHSSTIHNSEVMDAAYVLINRWMDKKDVVCVHIHTQWNTTQPWKRTNKCRL